jgi:hypothetical protein
VLYGWRVTEIDIVLATLDRTQCRRCILESVDPRVRETLTQHAVQQIAPFNRDPHVAALHALCRVDVIRARNHGSRRVKIRCGERNAMFAFRRAGNAHQHIDLIGTSRGEQLRHVRERFHIEFDIRPGERAQVVDAQSGQFTVIELFERRPTACQHADGQFARKGVRGTHIERRRRIRRRGRGKDRSTDRESGQQNQPAQQPAPQ